MLVLDASRRVTVYQEKAPHPEGDLASLTVYAFRTRCLVDRLKQNAREGQTFQVYSEIIPRMLQENARVFGWVFDGYWQYARTLDTYYATNMDILRDDAPDLSAWGVRTNLNPGTLGLKDTGTPSLPSNSRQQDIERLLANLQRGDIVPLDRIEEIFIRQALNITDGNITEAAHRLGISRSTIYRKLQEYGVIKP